MDEWLTELSRLSAKSQDIEGFSRLDVQRAKSCSPSRASVLIQSAVASGRLEFAGTVMRPSVCGSARATPLYRTVKKRKA